MAWSCNSEPFATSIRCLLQRMLFLLRCSSLSVNRCFHTYSSHLTPREALLQMEASWPPTWSPAAPNLPAQASLRLSGLALWRAAPAAPPELHAVLEAPSAAGEFGRPKRELFHRSPGLLPGVVCVCVVFVLCNSMLCGSICVCVMFCVCSMWF